MGVGKQIEKILQDRNMNVNEFASILGIRPQRVYNIIQRDTKKVQSELVEKMAKCLGVPCDYFASDASISDFIEKDSVTLAEYRDSQESMEDNILVRESSQNYIVNFGDKGKVSAKVYNTIDDLQSRQTIFEYYLSLLNDEGKKELIKRTAELSRLEEYKKK